MRIRNLHTFDFWFPYAGADDKGYRIKAKKLSPRLPADRFYDPALQRDWQKGKIDVLLDDADQAILGPEVVQCVTDSPVVVTEDGKDSEVTPTELPIEPPTDSVEDTVEDTVPEQVPDPIQDEVGLAEDDTQLPLHQAVTQDKHKSVPTAITDGLHCTECGRDKWVYIDAATKIPLCRYCKRRKTTQQNATKPVSTPKPADKPEPKSKPVHQMTTAADVAAALPTKGLPGTPGIPTPITGPTLGDLRAQNRRAQLGIPITQPIAGAKPKASIEGITAFMGDMTAKGTVGK